MRNAEIYLLGAVALIAVAAVVRGIGWLWEWVGR